MKLESTAIKPEGGTLRLVSQSRGDMQELLQLVARDREEVFRAKWENLNGDGSGTLVLDRQNTPTTVPDVSMSDADLDTKLVENSVKVPKDASRKTKLELLAKA